jgi:hypothetical protein
MREPSTFAGIASIVGFAASNVPETWKPYVIVLLTVFAFLAIIIPETTVRIASEMAEKDFDEVVYALVRTRNERGEHLFARVRQKDPQQAELDDFIDSLPNGEL